MTSYGIAPCQYSKNSEPEMVAILQCSKIDNWHDMTWQPLLNIPNKVYENHTIAHRCKEDFEKRGRVLNVRLLLWNEQAMENYSIGIEKVQSSSESMMYARLRFLRRILGLFTISPIWHFTLEELAWLVDCGPK